MPGTSDLRTGGDRRTQAVVIAQCPRVGGGPPGAPGVVAGKALEQERSQRRPGLVETKVEAGLEHVVIGLDPAVSLPGPGAQPVRAQQARSLPQRRIAGDQHPALAEGQVLVGKKAERPEVTDGSGVPRAGPTPDAV